MIKVPTGNMLASKINRFDPNRTMITIQENKNQMLGNDYQEDLRSMKSEFNYNEKKKFVELLGQKQIPSRLNGGYGLQQLNLGQQIINNDSENYRRSTHNGLNFMANSSETPIQS